VPVCFLCLSFFFLFLSVGYWNSATHRKLRVKLFCTCQINTVAMARNMERLYSYHSGCSCACWIWVRRVGRLSSQLGPTDDVQFALRLQCRRFPVVYTVEVGYDVMKGTEYFVSL
jgi:hypothetical protein